MTRFSLNGLNLVRQITKATEAVYFAKAEADAALVARAGAQDARDAAEDARDAAAAVALGDADAVLASALLNPASEAYEAAAATLAGRGTGSNESRSAIPNLLATIRTYDDETAPVVRLIGLGSSVGAGATLPDPATQAPSQRLFARMMDALNRTGTINYTLTNGSVNGTTIISAVNADADYDEAKAAAGGVPKVLALAYCMNDGAAAQYHASQTYPGFYSFGKQLIEKAQADGADVILFTSPHPHTERNAWAMPAGITVTYAGTGTGPTATTYPGSSYAESVVTVTSPSGDQVPADYRFLRINEAVRALARDTGSLLIDIEGHWFDAVAKHGQDALFNTGEIVHPNLLGHQESYWRGIEDFVQGLTRGGVGAPVFVPEPYEPPAADPDAYLYTGGNGAYGSYGSGAVIDLPIPASTAGTLTLMGQTGTGLREHTVVEIVASSTTVAVGTVRTVFTGSAPSNIASITGSGLNARVTLASNHGGGVIKWAYEYRAF